MRTILLATAIVGSAVTAPAAQPGGSCDRACLERMLDAYVDALVAHDVATLPVENGARFTENGQRLELGDGLWRTVTGKGTYAFRIADTERGQAVLMGTVREADTPTIFILRLKVAARRIVEVETLVIRNQMAAESLDRIGAPRRMFFEPVPPAERLSRGELVRIANMYDGFGLEQRHRPCRASPGWTDGLIALRSRRDLVAGYAFPAAFLPPDS